MNMRRWVWVTALWLGIGLPAVEAEEPPPSRFTSMIGGLLVSDRHLYIAESELDLPLLHIDPLTISYRYSETTPFFKENAQAQLLYVRYDLETDFELSEYTRLITLAGYRRTQFEDRPGSLSAYAVGAGVGSRWSNDRPWLEWSAVAGAYLSRDRLDANWWADLHAVWRIWEGAERQMLRTAYRPRLGLAMDIESANDDGAFHARYKVGPVLEVVSATGNQIRFQTRWYHTDGQPFYEDRDSALLLGVEVNAVLDDDVLLSTRDARPVGWLPLVWGQYDIGYGPSRMLQRFEMTAEVHDYLIGEHRLTAVLWYESRQEQRNGDFDNVSYSVSTGIQMPVGLASPLSQGDPLVMGCDYVHRSGHALNPDVSRVPPGAFLERDSVNIVPRLRLQTLGWDLPYRDPSIYESTTHWLNSIDWRVTLGYDFHHSRSRSNPAAQLGLNWDVATIRGHVIYVRGVGSIGNEIPDRRAECGVRRPRGRVFFSAEQYGLESHLARGSTVTVGIGFSL